MAAEGESLSDSQSEVSNASDRLLVFGPNKGATPPQGYRNFIFCLNFLFLFWITFLAFPPQKDFELLFLPGL